MLSSTRMRSTAASLFLLVCAWAVPAGAETPEPERPPVDQPVDGAELDGEAKKTAAVDPPPPPAIDPSVRPADTAEPPAAEVVEAAPAGGFAFGSYGRVGVGTDLRGSTPQAINVVRRGTRVVENSYTELDLYYQMTAERGVDLRTVTTLAAVDDLFHYTGEFDAQLALRNFYAEVARGEWGAWVGSRMYRGDDIYLLDYWPLDDINTLGGGLTFTRDRVHAGVHVGANRLIDPFQFQQRDVAAPNVGTETITELDRQRLVASTKGEYRFFGDGIGPSAKVKLYGEIQGLPSGSRTREDETVEELPSDFGYSIGAQLGAWGFARGRSHANLFARWSQGLTAFDELQLPEGFDASKKTFPSASELMLALSANYELARGGVLIGGYTRRFVDADPNEQDRDDGWEYIIDVRPHHAIVGDFEAAVDLSYQARFPRGISPTTLTALDPAVFQVAPMLLYSPFGTGSYARPQLRLVYRAAHLNEGARDLYALEDPRRDRSWVHFLGIQAEWWFNSTYR